MHGLLSLIIGLLLFITGFFMIVLYFPGLRAFIGSILFFIGAYLYAPAVAEKLSYTFGLLFWPDKPGKPCPTYSRAEAQALQRNYAEAERLYEEIIEEFPQELKAHAALLRIAMVNIGDLEKSTKRLQFGMETLTSETARNQLDELYHAYLKNFDRHIRFPLHSGHQTSAADSTATSPISR